MEVEAAAAPPPPAAPVDGYKSETPAVDPSRLLHNSVNRASVAQRVAEKTSEKRKLEEIGFVDSKYFKIRTLVKDLRPHFLEVLKSPDFNDCNGTHEILKKVRTILELSRQLRHELSSTDKPIQSSIHQPTGQAKFETAESAPLDDCKHNASEMAPVAKAKNEVSADKPEYSFDKITERTNEAKLTDANNSPKLLDDAIQGSYAEGGSIVDWKFLVYPGNKPIYYGTTRSEWLSRQAP